jgi:hypothetical protein
MSVSTDTGAKTTERPEASFFLEIRLYSAIVFALFGKYVRSIQHSRVRR